MTRLRLSPRQRATLSKVKNKERRARLLYNYQYDANKRAARAAGLIPNPQKSIVLKKPKNMSQKKFETLVKKFS